jgi:transcriptional regulator with XRE-family HTH domain
MKKRTDDIDELRHILGTALMAARERAGLTQAEVAARVGIATAVYGRLERGHMLPSLPTLFQLCLVLDIPANELIGLGPKELKRAGAVEAPRDPPELRRLAAFLPLLSPSSLRALLALASIIAR